MRPHRWMNLQHPQRGGAWRPGVVDSAQPHRQAGARAGGEVLDLAELGAVEGGGDSRQVSCRPGPRARRQVFATEVADRQGQNHLCHEHHPRARQASAIKPTLAVTVRLQLGDCGFSPGHIQSHDCADERLVTLVIHSRSDEPAVWSYSSYVR